MANHKSAKKRARQTITKTLRSSQAKKSVRTAEKKLRTAITDKNTDEAKTLLTSFVSKMSKAAQKGYYHANTLSRKVGRLSQQVSGISK
ncbi:MAG: 30S ribosomal protein S20 [Bdellovibrionaceae bacterium]|nr:30S ribosomal protein S20 [Pseudobdellovibrionaceae bacterium]